MHKTFFTSKLKRKRKHFFEKIEQNQQIINVKSLQVLTMRLVYICKILAMRNKFKKVKMNY